jgi:hypothetical protein
MAGYKVPARTVTFTFEDGTLKGLEAVFRVGLPIAVYVELSGMAKGAFDKKGTLTDAADLFRRVAEIGLVSWNMTGVPATPEAFVENIPADMAARLVGRYLSEIGALPGPLSPRSTATKRSARNSAKSLPTS